MQLSIQHSPHQRLQYRTKQFLKRQVSPLVGIVPEITLLKRSQRASHMFTMCTDLTGIHVLTGGSRAKPGAHHIGGNGFYYDEAMIRLLAESVERYAQVTSELGLVRALEFGTMDEMMKSGSTALSTEKLRYFSDQQLARPHFPYQAFSRETPLGWVKMHSMVNQTNCWVPAQLVLVGYQAKCNQGEPWLNSAVTTGTATHIKTPLALRSALLELIQLDTVMGFWYSNTVAYKIEFDYRTRHFENIINRFSPHHFRKPTFYWLQNPDLSGAYVACVFAGDSIPKLSVGLGADTSLVSAMYKAFLEAVGVIHLSKLTVYNEQIGNDLSIDDPTLHYNLDSNVSFYARGGNTELIHQKFFSAPSILANDLPQDMQGAASDHVLFLSQQFLDTGKALYYLDLTCMEAKELGFIVSRVWSPDILSLALPSAVPTKHARFLAYGGIVHEAPHPFP